MDPSPFFIEFYLADSSNYWNGPVFFLAGSITPTFFPTFGLLIDLVDNLRSITILFSVSEEECPFQPDLDFFFSSETETIGF